MQKPTPGKHDLNFASTTLQAMPGRRRQVEAQKSNRQSLAGSPLMVQSQAVQKHHLTG
jgi:hypothetical protein